MGTVERVRAVALAGLATVWAASALAEDGWVEVNLKHVPWRAGRSKEGYEHLPFTTPRSLEPGTPVTQGQQQFLPIAGEGGAGVRVTTLETSMELDLDGNGKPEAKAKGKDSCLALALKSQDGTPYDYTFRVTRVEISATSVEWIYQRSCFMEGTFEKTKIRLIDDDSDGVYGEMGRDAIAIGNDADHAVPLGPVVNVGGKLYSIRVHPSGTRLSLKPYEGPVGTLDAVSKYQSAGKLVWAVFRCGDQWFDAAPSDGRNTVLVPAGTYRFEMGRIYNRPQGARIRAGKMAPVDVRAGETATVEWGGPPVARFQYAFEGRILKIGPNGPSWGWSAGTWWATAAARSAATRSRWRVAAARSTGASSPRTSPRG